MMPTCRWRVQRGDLQIYGADRVLNGETLRGRIWVVKAFIAGWESRKQGRVELEGRNWLRTLRRRQR